MNGRVESQPQTDLDTAAAGPIGDEGEIEGRSVPRHDDARLEIQKSPIEAGQDLGLIAVEHDLEAVGAAESDCDYPARCGIEAVDSRVRLDVEAVPAPRRRRWDGVGGG